jgi:hypothetical protein
MSARDNYVAQLVSEAHQSIGLAYDAPQGPKTRAMLYSRAKTALVELLALIDRETAPPALKTHMCPVGACDAYGYEGDVCNQKFMHKGAPHGLMIPIPNLCGARDLSGARCGGKLVEHARGRVECALCGATVKRFSAESSADRSK